MTQPIQSLLNETRQFKPPQAFRASVSPDTAQLAAWHQQADNDYAGFWSDLARQHLRWSKPFTQTLNDHNPPFYRWFEDGLLNVADNCLDRHLEQHAEKTAIIYEAENGTVEQITYQQLYNRVCQFAHALEALSIHSGDRVVLYMPMIPEAAIAMLACARIGAVHSVVFAGFSAESLAERIDDTAARCVITADEGVRAGKPLALKTTVDQAISKTQQSVEHVVVLQHRQADIDWHERDCWWHDITHHQPQQHKARPLPAEHPLFILYTSGSTGKPKGIQHSTAGYLLGACLTNQWVFDVQPDDVFWCTADVGWITGHSYVVYGPLANAATIVMYEGAPTYPDAGRFWAICEKHQVSLFYTAPTALRVLMKAGDALPQQYDLQRLRLLGTVGEPINPKVWSWYFETVGQSRCPIVDTWWQTETGAIMIAPLPAVTATKPGSCTQPLPGIIADIVDEKGQPVPDNQGGYLVIKKPWPSMLRTIWGDDQRYQNTYFPKFDGQYYLTGDSARRDEDGYYWIMGRIDDVVNVSGHRLGTMEIESALVAHDQVAEAAVIGYAHEIKGEAIMAFCVLKSGQATIALRDTLKQWVVDQIGALARPEDIRFADQLPKTRSGKIMRRLLRTIAANEAITSDLSTLENEQIIDQLRHQMK